MQPSQELSPDAMVDLDRYPIGAGDPARRAAFARQCARQYRDSGLCMLPRFLAPRTVPLLVAEASALTGEAWFCDDTHDAYLNQGGQPGAGRERTFVGSVPYDRIGSDSLLRKLYLWDPLKDFIGAVLGKARFYRFADPLGACSINVFVDGGAHGWHFDESEFTVTLMLQPPRAGGAFEYVPRIRGLPDEQAIVDRVLEGDRSKVVELPFSPGTLLIFGGRQTLHRVTRVHGERPRLVPVLCYSEQPDLNNSPAVRKLFWGRSGEESQSLT